MLLGRLLRAGKIATTNAAGVGRAVVGWLAMRQAWSAWCAVLRILRPLSSACRHAAALLGNASAWERLRLLALVTNMTFAGALSGLFGGTGRDWSGEFITGRSLRGWVTGSPVTPGGTAPSFETLLLLLVGCRVGMRH